MERHGGLPLPGPGPGSLRAAAGKGIKRDFQSPPRLGLSQRRPGDEHLPGQPSGEETLRPELAMPRR